MSVIEIGNSHGICPLQDLRYPFFMRIYIDSWTNVWLHPDIIAYTTSEVDHLGP